MKELTCFRKKSHRRRCINACLSDVVFHKIYQDTRTIENVLSLLINVYANVLFYYDPHYTCIITFITFVIFRINYVSKSGTCGPVVVDKH